MKQTPLGRMLPIHEVRERRALRFLHEQQALHARAFEFQLSSALTVMKLKAEVSGAMGSFTADAPIWAVELQTLNRHLAQLEAHLVEADSEFQRAKGRVDEALANVQQAQRAHALTVLGSHKLKTAAQALAKSVGIAKASRNEGMADDEFILAWQVNSPKPEKTR